MLCVPTPRAAVKKEAMPVTSKVAPARNVFPSRKVTVPVGMPPPAPMTVELSRMNCPMMLGFALEVMVVVVIGGITVKKYGVIWPMTGLGEVDRKFWEAVASWPSVA